MNAEDVKLYVGKKVLIVLNNNFKFTLVIPNFDGDSFSAKDKYGNLTTISCGMISIISVFKNGGEQ